MAKATPSKPGEDSQAPKQAANEQPQAHQNETQRRAEAQHREQLKKTAPKTFKTGRGNTRIDN